MDTLMPMLLELPSRLKHPEFWSTRTSGATFATGCAILASAMAWTTQPENGGFFVLFARVTIAGGLGLGVGLCIWLIVREVYRRSGYGRRICLTYCGQRAPVSEWIEFKRIFSDLLEQSYTHGSISFKIFPKDQLRSDREKRKACVRYRMTAVFSVRVETSPKGYPADFTYDLDVFIPDPLENNIADYLDMHVASLNRPIDAHATPEALVRSRASTLFYAVVMGLALVSFRENKIDEAIFFFETADKHAAALFAIDNPIRRNIRHAACRLRVSRTSVGRELEAMPDQLETISGALEEAFAIYGSEFSDPVLALTRIELLRGSVPKAKEWANQLSNFPEDPFAAMALHLNHFVIAICEEHWERAREHIIRVFGEHSEAAMKLDWKDLAGFAGHLQLINYPAAVVIEKFYEALGSSDAKIFQKSEGWECLSQDGSRFALRNTMQCIISDLTPPK